MPAPKGNDFAAKDDRERIAFPVNVRGTKDERKAWRKAAAGQKWNEWARAALNAAAVHCRCERVVSRLPQNERTHLMTTDQLDHLRAIDAHLEHLLEIASKRTPGRWGTSNLDDIGTDYKCPLRVKAGDYDVARNGTPGCFLQSGDAAFIAACSNNAEAGWESTRAAIADWLLLHDTMPSMRVTASAALERILTQWPLESLNP